MNTQYPIFKKLELTDKAEVQSYLNKYLPYSDFNFFSIWCNNTEGDFLISKLNNNLVFHMKDYINGQPFFTFLGDNQVEDTIDTLLQLSIIEKYTPMLKLVPNHQFKTALFEKFDIQEDRDNFDYIYSAKEMSDLVGARFQNHRNFIYRFHNLHPSCKAQPIDLSDNLVQQQILNLAYDWAKTRDKSVDETKQEIGAIKRAVTHDSSFKLCPIGVFDGTKMVGFMIGDLDHPEYCQTHFAKADINYTGIYYVLYNFMAKQVLEKGYQFINNEQDLGIPGLRHSKVQWNPTRFLKKYIIGLKSSTN